MIDYQLVDTVLLIPPATTPAYFGKEILCACKSLICRQLVKPARFGVVTLDSPAMLIHLTEATQCECVAFVCCQSVEPARFGVVTLDSPAMLIHLTEAELGLCIPTASHETIESDGFSFISRDCPTIHEQPTEKASSFRIALLRSQTKVSTSLAIISFYPCTV